MSFHLHLRATTPSEVPGEFSSLLDFMWAAWEAHPAEDAAGIAESIEKDFGQVHELYTAGADRDDASSAASTLPIFGGRQVRGPTKDQPPFVVLDPAQVRAVAEFLRTLSFDERWQVAGTELSRQHLRWDGNNAARAIFLEHHGSLCTFYGRAALAGHAVIKAFWY